VEKDINKGIYVSEYKVLNLFLCILMLFFILPGLTCFIQRWRGGDVIS